MEELLSNDGLATGAGFATIATMFWWLMTKHLPTQQANFNSELAEMRQTFHTALDKVCDASKESNGEMAHALKDLQITIRAFGELLIRHDATVKGVNDLTIGTHEEIKDEWDKHKER